MTKRNYGIDLLRIVAMFMVVVMHLIVPGGIARTTEPFSHSYYVAWTMEMVCFCAVNCFGLISGFVGVDSKWKLGNYLNLWLTVFLYGVLAEVLMRRFVIEYVPQPFAGVMMPVTSAEYWYFTAYTLLFIFIPIINKGINSLDKKTQTFLLVFLLLIGSLIPWLRGDVFAFCNGYSGLWLTFMYVVGALIKKLDFSKHVHKLISLLGFIVSSAASTMAIVIRDFMYANLEPEIIDETWWLDFFDRGFSYTAPMVVAQGIFLVMFFSQIQFRELTTKVIEFFAPFAFGVYLIHVQPSVFEHFIVMNYTDYGTLGAKRMVLAILLRALRISAVCIAVEIIRAHLFKALKIDKLCSWVSSWTYPKIEKPQTQEKEI